MTPAITLTKALADPALLGGPFQAPSFWTWKTVAKLIDGEPLTEPREIELFKQCTGRRQLPNRKTRRALRRLIILCGRRAGKDRFLSARGGLALRRSPRIGASTSAPANRPLCCCSAPINARPRSYGGIARGFCRRRCWRGKCRGAPTTSSSFETARARDRDERCPPGARPQRHRGSRFRVLPLAHRRGRSVERRGGRRRRGAVDGDVSRRRPAAARQLGLSQARLHVPPVQEAARQRRGRRPLCWFAASRAMNPKLPQSVVDAALANDAPKARAEFENVWREDIDDFCRSTSSRPARTGAWSSGRRSGASVRCVLPTPPAAPGRTASRWRSAMR